MQPPQPRRLLFSLVTFGLLACSPLYATTVEVSGRQLLINGQPFTVKGVNYSPARVGYTLGVAGTGCVGPYHWWLDRPTYVADFPQIRRLGANTLRTFDLMNSTATSTEVLRALDEAQRNNLYVIMGYFVSHQGDITNDAAFRNRAQAEFLAAVQAYKSHPAVLMWAFGNENNIDNANTNPIWYQLLQQTAQLAKAIDPGHPITTVEGECFGSDCFPALPAGQSFSFHPGDNQFVPAFGQNLGANDASLTFLDLWSINVYRGTSFGTLFQTLVSSTTKPILVAEFGKDAWHDSIAAENQDMQSNYISSQWQEINANLSASGTGTASLVGGALFEWTDEWWKDSADNCSTHGTQTLFTRTSDTVDPNYQDEWFGITSVAPVQSVTNPDGTRRTFRKAFTSLQALWNPGGTTVTADASARFFNDTVRNFPNPFMVGTAPTKFVAFVNEAGTIDIRIYDASGQFVVGLPPLAAAGAGRYEAEWDGKNRQGAYVSSGLYYARIEGRSASREEKQFRKVVAVK